MSPNPVFLRLSPQTSAASYLLSFVIQRSDTGTDTGHGYGPGITPRGTLSACGEVPIVDAGKIWTYLGGGRDRSRNSDYPFDVAYRFPAPGGTEPLSNHWGTDPPDSLYADGRPTAYSLELSGASGTPVLLATLSNQSGGSTGPLVGPTVSCPGPGWLFGLFSNSTGGPSDGRPFYNFACADTDVVELRQAYASDQPSGTMFAPKAWLGYLPVSGGSHSITLTMSASTGSVENWGCAMVFVPGTALSVVQFVHVGGPTGGLCWDWTSAP